MTATLGGFRIVGVDWTGHLAVTVYIETDLTDRYLQLYAGRRLIGQTTSKGQLSVTGQLQPAHCPHHLMVVMCEEGDQLTDYGADLPPRPLNQFNLAWTEESSDDCQWFELFAATAAGGAVDTDNVVARIEYQGAGEYRFLFPPVTEPGEWTYQVTPRDNAATRGNAGTSASVSLSTVPYPPDVLMQSDGTRLSASIAAGTLTVDFDYDWDA